MSKISLTNLHDGVLGSDQTPLASNLTTAVSSLDMIPEVDRMSMKVSSAVR